MEAGAQVSKIVDKGWLHEGGVGGLMEFLLVFIDNGLFNVMACDHFHHIPLLVRGDYGSSSTVKLSIEVSDPASEGAL